MSEPQTEFEERLRRVQPRGISARMHGAVAEQLTLRPVRRDWPMLCAFGSSLAAACVIVAMLIAQTPSTASPMSAEHAMVVVTPQDPPAIYAFNFANSLSIEEGRRVR